MIYLQFTQVDHSNALSPGGFKVEWYAHAIELRRRWFSRYKDALDFAVRKAGRKHAISNEVPLHLQDMRGTPSCSLADIAARAAIAKATGETP